MFIPHSQTIENPGAKPDKWIVFLHGIYGSGPNWRAVARKLCAKRPDWGVVLADLRMHGKSQDAPAPHSLRSCAEDIYRLVDARAAEGMNIDAVLGHSFGGKVALDMKRMHQTGEHAKALTTWTVDSSPAGSRIALEEDSNIVIRVLRILREISREFASRSEFVAEFSSRGIPAVVAQWLGMNLESRGNGYYNRLDHEAMTALLLDYYEQDLWSVLASGSCPTDCRPTHLAVASRMSAIAADDQERLADMAGEHLVIHNVEGGHWLHVDAADVLVDLVAQSLD